ncbi:MAG: ABC transporter ATP-binding protein [Candidatus Eisenbacteria bacterium]|uniref:ABC transporter ATP-binding protein n=1 Tax=Eiseniibacteriota bacterium TaxID=2212470 RepID=A0A948RTT8_UNCEI|nr:ABC transporter ATP-binding protein [Candidatus Eisenbacteria bacterium]MBU2690888.1 ABC transporter ATP-binding protein [Candidatus Eisenbacteria bacterium]
MIFKAFDGTQALDSVTLSFPPSGITAIIGPNGAGKTTLLNCLTGFLRPDSGHHYIGETETTNMAPHRIARLGVARTFQDLRLISFVSVIDNVLTARPNQKGEGFLPALIRYGVEKEEVENRERSMQLLQFVGLKEKAEDIAGALSYGQQKLLTLAVCLATEARILLLDEPVAGVARQMIDQILDRLQVLREQGKAIVFIEHDIEAVRQVADHIIVMDDGKVIVEGGPREVLERPEIMEAYLG